MASLGGCTKKVLLGEVAGKEQYICYPLPTDLWREVEGGKHARAWSAVSSSKQLLSVPLIPRIVFGQGQLHSPGLLLIYVY
jgi:hypothetical protein